MVFIFSQELDTLEAVWNVALEWDKMYDEWKGTTFANINTIEMEYESQNIFKKIVKFSRELRVSSYYIETEMSRLPSACALDQEMLYKVRPRILGSKNKKYKKRSKRFTSLLMLDVL